MKAVLDTTAFTDSTLREYFKANSLRDVLKNILERIISATNRLGYEFYITPRMLEELRSFLLRNGCEQDDVEQLSLWLIVKSPASLEAKIPAYIMYSYIDELRKRIDKGLRVAEKAVRKAAEKSRENSVEKLDAVVGPLIRELREEYRLALRHGIVDSTVDFEIVLLAVELEGIIVSSDEGIRQLCDLLGIRVMRPADFYRLIDSRLASLE